MAINKIFKISVLASLIVSIILVGYSIYYHYVIYLPDKATKEGLEKVLGDVNKTEDTKKVELADSECNKEAMSKAKELLNKKIETLEINDSGSAAELPFYKEMAKGNSYITTDYENAYKNCLRSKGIEE